MQVSDPPPLDIGEESLGQIVDANVAAHAITDDFNGSGPLAVNSFGGGGEPDVVESDDAVDGDKSLQLSYPGDAFFEMEEDKDFSAYADGNLVFSMKKPTTLHDAEVKLESPGQATTAAIFLVDYTPEDIENGWVRYTVPMVDFSGLNLTQLKIPFALWNPRDASDAEFSFTGGILIDDIHIER